MELLFYANPYELTPSILPILIDDDPILKIPATEIDNIDDIDTQQLVVNMIETMKFANGIGIAAPQVGISKRLIVFYLPAARDDAGTGVPLTVLFNPVLDYLDNDKTVDFEGCLSVPGMRGQVSRHNRIQYSGFNERNEYICRIAVGWHARLVQHEFDHLNGILYHELIDKDADYPLITVEEWRKISEKK